MGERAAQSGPGAQEPTEGHNIWHIVIAMFIFPPFGVYLLYGGFDMQVGLNVLAWFLFIAPAYIHGFVLLIWKKAWPEFVPQFREVRQQVQETGYILAESWVTAVETTAHVLIGELAGKFKSRDAARDSAAGPPS